MRSLRGPGLARALRVSRAAVWAAVAMLAALVLWQAAGLVCALTPRHADGPDASVAARPSLEPSMASLPNSEAFSIIWERLEVPVQAQPRVVAAPKPAPPQPPPNPYPDLRLLGTFVEEGHSYALIQVRKGVVKLLAEGDSHEDLSVLSVEPDTAILALPHTTLPIGLPHRAPPIPDAGLQAERAH